MKIRTMMGDCQMAFAFAGECVREYVRPGVLGLSRCTVTGKDVGVKYETWLEWAGRLSGATYRVNGGGR